MTPEVNVNFACIKDLKLPTVNDGSKWKHVPLNLNLLKTKMMIILSVYHDSGTCEIIKKTQLGTYNELQLARKKTKITT